MKTCYSLSLAFLASLSPLYLSAETKGGVTRITKTTEVPTIDGTLDAVWYNGYASNIGVVQAGMIEDAADSSATWYGLYTDEKFYLFVDITDQYVTSTDGDQRWVQDLVEVYFNIDNVKPNGGNGRVGDNFQIAFNYEMPDAENGAGANLENAWTGIEWVQVKTDTGWAMEASFEWSALGVAAPVMGTDIGFDIAVIDNDGLANRDSILYWRNSGGGLFGNIDGAGTIVLWDDAIEVMPKFASAPTIDGTMDEIFNASGGIDIGIVQSGHFDGAADGSAVWYGGYTDDTFYLFVDITDQYLTSTDGDAIWRQDRVEVFFDIDRLKPGGSGGTKLDNKQFAFNWNITDQGGGTGIVWEFVTTDKGWALEASIPWSTIGFTTAPTAGDLVGFDIAVNDNDGNSAYDGVLYWHNASSKALFSSIDGAGTIELGAAFDGNYPPAFESLDAQIAVEGVASSFNVVATDLNTSDTLTITSGTLPAALGLVDNGDGTATVAVNALTADVGVHQFPVTVSDGTLSDTMLVTVLIQPVGGASSPVISDITAISMLEGEVVLQNVFVTDVDSKAVSIVGVDLPAFVSILDYSDGTARLTLDPISGESGDYTISLEATDESGNVGTLSFDVSVSANWRGLAMDQDSNVETPGPLGWLYVAHDPWLYVYALETWLYIPDNGDEPSHWMYGADLGF